MYSLKIAFFFSFIIPIFSSPLFAQTGADTSRKLTNVRNLVFEGGGIRGIAYAGSLMELEAHYSLDSIERAAGTSVGAIAATLFALGYTPKEISDLISELKIKSFADGKWMFIGGMRRLIKNFGWYKGEKFTRWISAIIRTKTGKENITFRELYQLSLANPRLKDLYLTGTNLTLQKAEVFCKETYPDMEVRTAVRISIGIPFYFQAIVVNKEGKALRTKKDFCKGYVMIDGGVTANFPVHIFDYTKYITNAGDSTHVFNKQTLGFRLDSEKQIEYDRKRAGLAPYEVNDVADFTSAFYNIVIENLNRQQLVPEDWKRTVSVGTAGIGERIRKLSSEEKNRLIQSGRKGVQEYLQSL